MDISPSFTQDKINVARKGWEEHDEALQEEKAVVNGGVRPHRKPICDDALRKNGGLRSGARVAQRPIKGFP